jgi:hypothetical protein
MTNGTSRSKRPGSQACTGRGGGSCSPLAILLVGILVASCGVAAAQPAPPLEAERRLGPISYNPGLVFSSGYDTNPWREGTAEGVRDAFETYITPQVAGWMHLGSLRTDMYGAIEIVKAGEGVTSKNYQAGTNLVWNGARFVPYLLFTSKHTNANPTGFEVGRKSMRIEHDLKSGVSMKLGPAAQVFSYVRRTKTNWDADAIYQSSSLREKLNRTDIGVVSGIGVALTALTSVRFYGESNSSDFLYSPIRNGSGYRLGAGLTITGPAAIVGNVDLGVRQFNSQASDLSFRGMFGTVSLAREFSTGTVVGFRFDRDLQFSYDTSLAYFVGQSIEVTAIQPVGEKIGLQAYVGRHKLLYAQHVSGAAPLNGVTEFSVAVGRQVRQRLRAGVSTEWAAARGTQPWDQLRVIAFVTYGSGPFQRLDRPIPFQR